MLERIQNVLRNRKEGDKGFSLVELAIVVVILGILVAIAVPIFANLTTQAETNTLKAAAANGASIVAVNIANGDAAYDNVGSAGDGANIVVRQATAADTGAAAGGTTMSTFCVAADRSGTVQLSGPGCP